MDQETLENIRYPVRSDVDWACSQLDSLSDQKLARSESSVPHLVLHPARHLQLFGQYDVHRGWTENSVTS